jgi:hypothetical protein
MGAWRALHPLLHQLESLILRRDLFFRGLNSQLTSEGGEGYVSSPLRRALQTRNKRSRSPSVRLSWLSARRAKRISAALAYFFPLFGASDRGRLWGYSLAGISRWEREGRCGSLINMHWIRKIEVILGRNYGNLVISYYMQTPVLSASSAEARQPQDVARQLELRCRKFVTRTALHRNLAEM